MKIELRTDQWEEHDKTIKVLNTLGLAFFIAGILTLGGIYLQSKWMLYSVAGIQLIIGFLIERTHAQWSQKHGSQ